MENVDTVRLTQTVQKGGCAAKVAAVELRKILSRVTFPPAPNDLLIGTGTFDDAAVFLVPNRTTGTELAIVQTLDFFTPIVDTPKLFGRIAAANALSDVYAMGALPSTAMAIFAFPVDQLSSDIAVDVLQGASDTIKESGAALVGGHTIDDDTMKFGLSVTGFVDPKKVWSNAGAKPQDILILTKPLGTGTLTAALKRGAVSEDDINDGLESMCRLNDVPAHLPPELFPFIHAATDVTGFGLAGHALNMARASAVCLQIDGANLPRFAKATSLLSEGFLTKAHRTNREYVLNETEIVNPDAIEQQLMFDPQTSGGLLLAVDPVHAVEILKVITTRFPQAAIVGRVNKLTQKHLRLT